MLILDAARIGPEYLPGHAHADTLSFELSLGGVRALVNSGISCYGVSAERLPQRGTAAHNTVVVNEADSSEVWSGFRVARRAVPTEFEIEMEDTDRIRIRAAHDGYRRLHRSIRHRRWWTFEPQRLQIEDEVAGQSKTAAAYFRLGPAWHQVLPLDQFQWQHDNCRLSCQLTHAVGTVIESQWHPGFGLSEPVSMLRCVPTGSCWEQEWNWELG